eukprot:Gb_15131 [translate_table: standard]
MDEDLWQRLSLLDDLPNELAIRCLARLPRKSRAIARCVSRSWNYALRPSHLKSIYHSLMDVPFPSENWPLIYEGTRNGIGCHPGFGYGLVDPLSMRVTPVRMAIGIFPEDEEDGKKFTEIEVVLEYMFLGLTIQSEGPPLIAPNDRIICWLRDCSHISPMKAVRRNCYAWAVMGKFIYVAGGCLDAEGAVRSAERYDIEKQRWEDLPDMPHAAVGCSGFVMDGKFCVVGSHMSRAYARRLQCYNPEIRNWTSVSDGAPRGAAFARKAMATVLKNKLYLTKQNRESIWEHNAATRLFSESLMHGDYLDIKNLTNVGEELWVTTRSTIIVYNLNKKYTEYNCTNVSLIFPPPYHGREVQYISCLGTYRVVPF